MYDDNWRKKKKEKDPFDLALEEFYAYFDRSISAAQLHAYKNFLASNTICIDKLNTFISYWKNTSEKLPTKLQVKNFMINKYGHTNSDDLTSKKCPQGICTKYGSCGWIEVVKKSDVKTEFDVASAKTKFLHGCKCTNPFEYEKIMQHYTLV